MKVKQLLKVCRVLSAIVLLAGCVETHPTEPIKKDAYLTVKADSPLILCQTEVQVLANYDSPRYQQQQTALNDLLERSAKYLLIRSQVSEDMQTVLDSVYQAQLAKRCHQIHSELFHVMVEQADKA